MPLTGFLKRLFPVKIIIPFLLGLVLSYWAILIIGFSSESLFEKTVQQPIEAMKFVAFQMKEPQKINDWWFVPEVSSKKGVTRYDKDKSWGDYTMFNRADMKTVFLMDMNGEIVFQWDAKFPPEQLAFNDWATMTKTTSDPENRENIYAMYIGEKEVLNSYGIKKFDHEGHVLWENNRDFHHDIAFLEDGTILTFEQRMREVEHYFLPQIKTPFIDEYLVFLDKEGKVTHEISIIDAFVDSEFKYALMGLTYEQAGDLQDGDLFHPNTITPVPKHVAEAYDKVTKNSVMLSFRNIDMIAFLDLPSGKITWALYGPWKGQHGTKFTKDGHVIMLDNQGSTGPGRCSRILEVDLHDMSIVWKYAGNREKPFCTQFNGMFELLPNGNILVTETSAGRIFEVNRDKEIVWEYYIKDRVKKDGVQRIASVFCAQRFTREEMASVLGK